MKNQYVGDIGDFGKVLLLKHLTGLGFRIGVNWVMTRNDNGPDGNQRDYVGYRGTHCLCSCDIELFASITPLAVKPQDERKIENLEEVIKTFSPKTAFYRDYFDDIGGREKRSREACRRLTGSDTDLVFVDPDNGLANGPPISCKHVYLEELERYWNKGKSLLIYHHLPQRRAAQPVIDYWTGVLKGLEDGKLTHFRFRRGTGRVYFLCVQPQHMNLISSDRAVPAFAPLLARKADWAKQRRMARESCSEVHPWYFTN